MSFRSGYGQKCAIELYRDATERQANLERIFLDIIGYQSQPSA